MTVVRWGILGAANFAKQHMARAIHAAEGGTLAALATSSAEKAEGFKAFAPDLKVHDTYDALLNDPDIDAVYIPLPNHLHVEWTLRAVAAGKAVLCEKPIAMNAKEIDRLIEARDDAGVLVAEAYMIVHHPQWRKARRLLHEGKIGTLTDAQVRFSFNNPDPDNIRNQSGTGGGGLPDIGVYAFGSVRYVTGEEPEAILSTDVTWENGVDTRAHVTARFPSFHYTGMVSTRMSPYQEVLFHGDEGVIRLTAPFNAGVYDQAEVHLQTPDGTVTTWRFPNVNQYVLQVEAFNRSVADQVVYPCPLEFSKGTQRMIDMVYEDAKG